MMLKAGGVGVPDDPLCRYTLPGRAAQARVVAEVACEQGLGDEVAWEVMLGDVTREYRDAKGRIRLRLSPTLEAYRVVYGNRKGNGGRRVASGTGPPAAPPERVAGRGDRTGRGVGGETQGRLW